VELKNVLTLVRKTRVGVSQCGFAFELELKLEKQLIEQEGDVVMLP
jgi:hypothetical protein